MTEPQADTNRSSSDESAARPAPFTQGWLIVGFTFVVQFMTVGIGYYTFGVYLKPLTEALDADRFLVSLTLSLQTLIAAVLSPWIGRLLARGSLRPPMLTGVLTMSAGLFVMSQATSLWHLYLGYGLAVSFGMAFAGVLPNNTLLANWFVRRRGTALGISQFGLTISGTVLVPLTTWLVLEYGWRTSFVVWGTVTPLLLVPLILRFAIKHPEDVGLHPDGATEPIPDTTVTDDVEWTVARTIRNREVWLLTLIVGPSYLAISSIVLALHSHSTDLGRTALEASSIVALTTLMGAVAKPVFGTLADYLDKRAVVAVALGLQAAGVAVLLNVDSYTGLLTAGFFFGSGYGAMAPLWSVLLAERFGRESFARVMGSMMPLLMPFTMIGLPFTTLVFEYTNSYQPAFTTVLGGYVVSAIALAMFRLPKPVDAEADVSAPA